MTLRGRPHWGEAPGLVWLHLATVAAALVLNAMRDSIATEIDHQVEVWGSPTIGTVDYYVDYVLDYNVTRRNTARSHINTSFSLSGQRTITLSVEPEGHHIFSRRIKLHQLRQRLHYFLETKQDKPCIEKE